MYKVGQIVKYKQPLRIENKGEIMVKLKVLDNKDGFYINSNIYLISSSPILQNDLVLEKDIMEVLGK